MKKLFILALALVPAVVSAQSANISVSTTIRDEFTLSLVDTLDFGQVLVGDAAEVLALTNATTSTGSGAQRGVITSTALGATVYTVSGLSISGQTANPTISLPKTVGSPAPAAASLTVTLNFAVNSASPTAYTLGTSTGASNAAGNTLYIGGTLPVTSEDEIGATYTGVLTVTAVYL